MIERDYVLKYLQNRAVAIDMTPIFSGVYRSTDSEAMNIVEVIDEVKEICRDDVYIYTGNGHTTTKISVGMAYLSHGVIAMRKHIYVDGLNVQKMVEDLGHLILKNVSRTGMPIDEICNTVERSNRIPIIIICEYRFYCDSWLIVVRRSV